MRSFQARYGHGNFVCELCSLAPPFIPRAFKKYLCLPRQQLNARHNFSTASFPKTRTEGFAHVIPALRYLGLMSWCTCMDALLVALLLALVPKLDEKAQISRIFFVNVVWRRLRTGACQPDRLTCTARIPPSFGAPLSDFVAIFDVEF